jgi:glycogen synthase kinase 3 beta
VFRTRATPDALDLISKLLEYTPTARFTAIEAMIHPFFDELRLPDWKLPSGNEPPPLFDFTAMGIIYYSLFILDVTVLFIHYL